MESSPSKTRSAGPDRSTWSPSTRHAHRPTRDVNAPTDPAHPCLRSTGWRGRAAAAPVPQEGLTAPRSCTRIRMLPHPVDDERVRRTTNSMFAPCSGLGLHDRDVGRQLGAVELLVAGQCDRRRAGCRTSMPSPGRATGSSRARTSGSVPSSRQAPSSTSESRPHSARRCARPPLVPIGMLPPPAVRRSPCSRRNAVKTRMPLPHISATDPSALW